MRWPRLEIELRRELDSTREYRVIELDPQQTGTTIRRWARLLQLASRPVPQLIRFFSHLSIESTIQLIDCCQLYNANACNSMLH